MVIPVTSSPSEKAGVVLDGFRANRRIHNGNYFQIPVAFSMEDTHRCGLFGQGSVRTLQKASTQLSS